MNALDGYKTYGFAGLYILTIIIEQFYQSVDLTEARAAMVMLGLVTLRHGVKTENTQTQQKVEKIINLIEQGK